MQQTSKCNRLHMTGWEDYSLGIVQEIKIKPYYQMVYGQIKICPREWDTSYLFAEMQSVYCRAPSNYVVDFLSTLYIYISLRKNNKPVTLGL